MSAPDRLTFWLTKPHLREAARNACMLAPEGYLCTIRPAGRTLPQNNLLHALLTEAVQKGLATDSGRRLTVTEAKVAMVSAWMDDTEQNSDMVMFGRRPVQLRRSTTELDKDEFSELVEFILAECALRGIQLKEQA